MRSLTVKLAITLLPLLLASCQNLEQPAGSAVETETQAALETAARSSRPTATSPVTESQAASAEAPIIYEDLWQRIRDGFQLQAHYSHPNVVSYIDYYSQRQRYFDLLQARASPFLFEIVEEIERRGLPLEFALLPMVESTYNPNAYSREHAVGLWQFVGATGKSFGLQQDWWFDGRRDPVASTHAALDYMEQLHTQFEGDWLLAIAAYNTGDGNLRRAIRRNEAEDINFWALDLPGETEAHVPKLLALAAIIAENNTWGIELGSLPNEAVLRSVEIGSQIDISQAANLAEIDYEELRALNPGYLQWATHPDQPQAMLLPYANAEALEEALTGLDKRDLLTWDRYEIQAGDTLGAIARRLGTRVDILQTFNSLPDSRIKAGASLLIPRTNDPQLLASAPRIEREPARAPVQLPAEYTVRRGDNLWGIARRFQLRSAEIAAWNQMALDELLQPGQVLDLSYALNQESDKPATAANAKAPLYIVKRGDSMDSIARRLDIDLQKLLLWNGLQMDELIFPGQELLTAAQSLGN